jgi:hypothetical protein
MRSLVKSRLFLSGYHPQKFLHFSVVGRERIHYSIAKGAIFADPHGYTRQLLVKVGFETFVSLVYVLTHVSPNVCVLYSIALFLLFF